MNCEEAAKAMYEGTEGVPDRELAEHLEHCENCRSEFHKLKRLDEIVRSVPRPRPTRRKLAGTVDLVVQEAGAGNGSGAYLWGSLAVAAAAAVVVGMLYYGGAFSRPPAQQALPATAIAGHVEPIPEAPPAADVPVADNSAAQPSEPDDDMLVDRLVESDLALAEAQGPGQKALVFSGMSQHLLAAMQATLNRGETEEAGGLGRGYTKVLAEGVLANVRQAGSTKDHTGLSEALKILEDNCRVLQLLAAGDDGADKELLAAALADSELCLGAVRNIVEQ